MHVSNHVRVQLLALIFVSVPTLEMENCIKQLESCALLFEKTDITDEQRVAVVSGLISTIQRVNIEPSDNVKLLAKVTEVPFTEDSSPKFARTRLATSLVLRAPVSQPSHVDAGTTWAAVSSPVWQQRLFSPT